jgi:acyl phosphate:glycerol-3-phosphate acyltransferase
MILTLIFCLIAYCLGSISSAIIVCRLAGLPDPRSTGSKNPGATNVLRLGGKRLAAITLLGDALKGFIPVLIVRWINPSPFVVGPVMLAAFLGHLYPIFFGFKGGKGVATLIGGLFGLSLSLGGLFIATWVVMAAIFRISSLAALTAAVLAPIYTCIILNLEYAFFVAIMSAILIWRHKENIKKILAGTEGKLGQKQ